jgi:putative two-component system response regulator
MQLRVRNLLETRFLHLRLSNQNEALEELVGERTQELREAQREVVARLALAAEYRDDETGQHALRVGRLAERIALELGLPADEALRIGQAAPLHDVGKIGIQDLILLKPGKLTPDEYGVIKRHTTIGAGILCGSRSPLLQLAEAIALYHHERWDGGGYAGLAGETIPLEARIVAVADAFDVMTHSRRYRAALAREAALAEIERQSGKQFDPAITAAFARIEHSIVATEDRK